MKAHSAQKDRHIEELQAQLRTQRLSSNPESGSGFGNSYSGGSGTVVVVVAVEDPVVGVVPVVDEELGAKADAEVTVKKTAPRTQNFIQD
jgi:hypothetical protein